MYKIINTDIFSAFNYPNDNSIDIAITSPSLLDEKKHPSRKTIYSSVKLPI